MSYMATYTGRKIDFSNLNAESICLEDIAHGLTKYCRYGGALPLHIHLSVASHSLNICHYAIDHGMSEDTARYALLHDASEAYLGDITKALKDLLPDYRRIEKQLTDIIFCKYGIVNTCHIEKVVKNLDTRIVLDETIDTMGRHYKLYSHQLLGHMPLGIDVVRDKYLSCTKKAFLLTCELLGIKD